MARFTGGWFKTHRSLFKHWIGDDLATLGFFIRLVGMANIKDSKNLRNANFIEVKRGDILTSSHELAVKCGKSRKWIEKRLDLLETDGTIAQQKNHLGRLITICNYNDYQDNDTDEGTAEEHQKNQRGTTEAPRKNHRGTHREEAKNNKKKRSKEVILVSAPSGSETTVEILDDSPSKFIARYCEVYKQKYSVNPVITPQVSGLAKKIVQQLGLMRACALIERYLQMNDRWFITKHHDLPTFWGNLNKVELFKQTGVKITQSQAQQVELEDSNRQVIENYFKEKGI